MAFIQDRAPYMVPTYVRPAPMMVKGQGCYLWDMENRRYLDLTAGIAVNSLGHCDPEISKIIAEQVCIRRPTVDARDNVIANGAPIYRPRL
ncbi:acetylornithine aminotransferase [Aspergillus melleus]|uniref:acetylornithine aminotransferase n=1 Tax=Aspergillus melleus TaxID=138277 RepID=UPI001E8D0FA6|nr:acetylornithine aminotransferase [Aspergillus melleus]KAH8424765.1 acetylornithine aminotransferase [Aspergillus melleus]